MNLMEASVRQKVLQEANVTLRSKLITTNDNLYILQTTPPTLLDHTE